MLDGIDEEGRPMTAALDLSYPAILKLFGNHLIAGRVESRALLGWFLENYYRLDETDAQDAICDGPDDKGVDGIFVDEYIERIVLFKTKLRPNGPQQPVDDALKQLDGIPAI